MSADMNIDQGDNSRRPGAVDFRKRAAPSEGGACVSAAPGAACGAADVDDGCTGVGGGDAAGDASDAGGWGAATGAGCCASAIDASDMMTSAASDLRMVLNIAALS